MKLRWASSVRCVCETSRRMDRIFTGFSRKTLTGGSWISSRTRIVDQCVSLKSLIYGETLFFRVAVAATGSDTARPTSDKTLWNAIVAGSQYANINDFFTTATYLYICKYIVNQTTALWRNEPIELLRINRIIDQSTRHTCIQLLNAIFVYIYNRFSSKAINVFFLSFANMLLRINSNEQSTYCQ